MTELRTYRIIDKKLNAIIGEYSLVGQPPDDTYAQDKDRYTTIDITDLPAAYLVGMYHGRRELSKIEFRRLFPAVKRPFVDEFNGTFDAYPALTDDQKREIRSGLEDYKASSLVNLDDPDSQKMVGLYAMLGLLTAEEAQGVLNG